MMKELIFNNEIVRSKTFGDLNIDKFDATSCQFSDCTFQKLKIKEVCFGSGVIPTLYKNCLFGDATLSSHAPGRATFIGCKFNNVKFVRLFCTEIIFKKCFFSGDFQKGNIVGELANLREDSIRADDNDFTQLRFGDVSFHDLDFAKQKFCKEDRALIIENVEDFIVQAKKQLDTISDFSLHDDAYRIVEILELKNEDTNNQMFFNPKNFPKHLEAAARHIASYIRF
ncbi:hypothetical protein PN836_011325 [Ningiella sp. W23]|uniref:hypothetical protein n=1 Tax=Ningiella sp. W23 TaxID=3023715 RepID=UPI003757265E